MTNLAGLPPLGQKQPKVAKARRKAVRRLSAKRAAPGTIAASLAKALITTAPARSTRLTGTAGSCWRRWLTCSWGNSSPEPDGAAGSVRAHNLNRLHPHRKGTTMKTTVPTLAFLTALAATPLHAGGPVIIEDTYDAEPAATLTPGQKIAIGLGLLAIGFLIKGGSSDVCNGPETTPQPPTEGC